MLSAILLCMATTLVALICLKRHAPRLGLVERPHGHRTHDLPTPVVGGLGIATGLLVTWLAPNTVEPGTASMLGALGLVWLGVRDDRDPLPARTKFLAQAAIVTGAVAYEGSLLYTLGELWPGIELRLAVLALPFTVFAVLGLINAVNMLDGLDGLAGKVMLAAFGWLAASMWTVGGSNRLAANLAIIGALSVFLLFNARFPGRPRALVFMGDAGSMLLGYLVAIAAIEATQRSAGIPPVTALWICALPILDTLSVVAQRIREGRPPMAAGRDHLHHLLRAHGLSVGKVTLTETVIAAALGLVGVAGWRKGVPDWIMFASFVAVGLAFHRGCRIAWLDLRAREAAVAVLVSAAIQPQLVPSQADAPRIAPLPAPAHPESQP